MQSSTVTYSNRLQSRIRQGNATGHEEPLANYIASPDPTLRTAVNSADSTYETRPRYLTCNQRQLALVLSVSI